MNYFFELSETRTITEANYNTFVRPALHPDRIMQEHDFLYILDGHWEIMLEPKSEASSCGRTLSDGQTDTPAIPQCELIQAQTGDLVILPAQIHHYGTALCSPNCKNMYIHASLASGDHLPSQNHEPAADGAFILLPSIIHCAHNTAISDYFSEIITVCWSDSPWKFRKLSCLFDLLLCEIKEQQDKTPAASKHIAFVDSVAKFLQANPQTFFTTSEIASRFYVSERTLNNRFHEVYHKTLYTWQMEQKLEMVRQFLRATPGITLRETASNFGFYDEFHLSKAFKKYFGVSPKYMH